MEIHHCLQMVEGWISITRYKTCILKHKIQLKVAESVKKLRDSENGPPIPHLPTVGA